MSRVVTQLAAQWSYRGRMVAAAITAGVLVAGSPALATIPDASGVIHACYQKSAGTLRIIDSALTGCKVNETEVSWNAQGPPGATGPSDAFHVDQRGSFSSQSLDPTIFTTLVQLSLPAGTFVVNGLAAIVGTTDFHTAQCVIRTSSGNLSDTVQTSIGGSAIAFGTMTLTTTFTLAAPTEVALVCRGSSDDLSTQPSTMNAIQVGVLDDQSPQ